MAFVEKPFGRKSVARLAEQAAPTFGQKGSANDSELIANGTLTSDVNAKRAVENADFKYNQCIKLSLVWHFFER